VQLLHCWAPLGLLWAWVEHRYGLQEGSLYWFCGGTYLVLGCVLDFWALVLSPVS
jgi:hypothetical protein